jgi:hypothetical protein
MAEIFHGLRVAKEPCEGVPLVRASAELSPKAEHPFERTDGRKDALNEHYTISQISSHR